MIRACVVVLVALAACKFPDLVPRTDGGGDDGDIDGAPPGSCAARGLPPTTISGTVFAPNGTLPLHGVTVYVPMIEPGPLDTGAGCHRCTASLSGGSVVRTTTNAMGRFTLADAPAGPDIRLVAQTGKWRRQITATITECQDNPIDISLPRNKTEGDLPRMAFISGACDQLECVLRKIGVDDTEVTNDMNPGSIHLYTTQGAPATHGNGTPLTEATALWPNLSKLMTYDAMFLGCECNQNDMTKTQQMYDALQEYADAGGRIYATHYQQVWIDGKLGGGATAAPSAQWQQVLTCTTEGTPMPAATIDQVNNPDGADFATWLQFVNATVQLGQIQIAQQARQTCTSLDETLADQWMFQTATGQPQMVHFTTPIGTPESQRCGKVMFSDMHATDTGGVMFPGGCETGPLTPQQKAFTYVLFELTGCIGPAP